MDIILWRHADAEDGIPDEGRKLTQKGEKQAQKVAKWLKERLPSDTRILVSPAKRTQQTVSHLTDKYETVKEIASGATVKNVLSAIGEINDTSYETVLIVGHQPTLGMVAAYLLGSREAHITVKKGSIWWFRYDDEGVTLMAVITPEMA